MRPDVMMVDLTTNDLHKKEDRFTRNCRANREQSLLKDSIGPGKVTILEIGCIAKTRFDDKYQANTQQHRSLCQILDKEGHELKSTPSSREDKNLSSTATKLL